MARRQHVNWEEMTLSEARDYLRSLVQRSNKKIERYESKGIKLKGSKFNPNRSAMSIQRMGLKQIGRAIDRNLDFLTPSNSNRFVKGRGGDPIRLSDYKRNDHLRDRYESDIERRRGLAEGITLSGQSYGDATRAFHDKADGVDSDINGVHYLPQKPRTQSSIEHENRRLADVVNHSKYKDDVAKEQEKFAQIMNWRGRQDVEKAIKRLTPAQFALLNDFVGGLDKMAYTGVSGTSEDEIMIDEADEPLSDLARKANQLSQYKVDF